MSPLPLLLLLGFGGVALLAALLLQPPPLRRWLLSCAWQACARRGPSDADTVHVLLCMADHYEPKANRASPAVARDRVRHWVEQYPRQFGRFRDSDGFTPRHSFFFPAEEYEPEYLDALAGLCRQGFGEVEIHLHHDRDTAEGFCRTLVWFKDVLANRHGLLARHADTGELAYGFIHGNWALCNARPDGRLCGVNNELAILAETRCYADFTMPAAPDAAQTHKINSIYYAVDKPGQPRSADEGIDVGDDSSQGSGVRGQGSEIKGLPAPKDGLLLIQGPLVLSWRQARMGIMPRLENGCLQASQPPCIERLDDWLRAGVQVPQRPDWYFVKLHAHGAVEESHEALLGEPMVRFHEALTERARANPRFHFHYVTAQREMYNLVKAAEAGWQGSVADARDFLLRSNLQAVSPTKACV